MSAELETKRVELATEIEFIQKDLKLVANGIPPFRRQYDDVERRKAEVNLRILNLRRQQDEAVT